METPLKKDIPPANYRMLHHPECREKKCVTNCSVFKHSRTGVWKEPELVKRWIVLYEKHACCSFYRLKIYKNSSLRGKYRSKLAFCIQNATLELARELDKAFQDTVSLNK